jgi:hypothetical protein
LATLVSGNIPSRVRSQDIDVSVFPEPVFHELMLCPVQSVTSELAAQQVSTNLLYGTIASVIARECLYRATPPKFTTAMYEAEDLLKEDFVDMVERNRDALDAMIDESRDELFN